MKFKVGDKVVGNVSNYSHRVGQYGIVVPSHGIGTWVEWANGETFEAKPGGIDLVEPTHEPTPPRKMHPDDFMLAISEFAADNGFHIKEIEALTKGGNTINRRFPTITHY